MPSETKKLIQFDWAIKTLLREKANFPILEGFLSELLDTDVKIDSLLESESNKAHSKDRSNRVDVLAQLGNGEKVIIEVQCERQWDFLSRMLYGVSKVVVEHLEQGEAYGKIPRVISVNIVYFNLGHGEDYIYRGTTQFHGLHKKDTLQLSQKEREHYPSHIDHLSHIFPEDFFRNSTADANDSVASVLASSSTSLYTAGLRAEAPCPSSPAASFERSLEYYVLKVSGFDLKIRDTLDEWIYTLKEAEVKPEFSAKGIHQAAQKLAVLNLSQEERVAYDRHVGDARISRSTLESSFVDGLHQGITQGKESMIRNFHQLGIPLEQIATAAELPLEEVKAILHHE